MRIEREDSIMEFIDYLTTRKPNTKEEKERFLK